ncbi:hypothetical protein J6590_032907 [Homalodisca vitripennis]|nr:hypothetical protein J6590_032907 [Homalodisca vitripennis]
MRQLPDKPSPTIRFPVPAISLIGTPLYRPLTSRDQESVSTSLSLYNVLAAIDLHSVPNRNVQEATRVIKTCMEIQRLVDIVTVWRGKPNTGHVQTWGLRGG